MKSIRGGKRPGSGRPKGAVNKATADVRALAQKYTHAAMAELARLAASAESEAARVAAIKELLDRGYGRSMQPTELSGPDGGPIRIVTGVPRADD